MEKLITILLLICIIQTAHAQHDSARKQDSMDDMSNMGGMGNMDTIKMTPDKHMNGMSGGLSRNLPMTRDGSGTAWLPDASPMYGYMVHTHKWMLMFHGDIFVRYNHQDITNAGSKGGEKWDTPDMLMMMAQRKIGKKGLFHFNAMFSADNVTAGGSGYPLLFQTGESWQDKPLVNRQHPHDLFSELSVSYAYSFNKKTDLYLYAGYPGEPALGPVVFMHRPSGSFIPDAPIGHHWQDATHITFGVATLGFRYGKFKLEGSSFTGREPNENRYNFDKPLFDSWSGRVSYNPSDNWALQVSRGYIKSPEALLPKEDIDRTTASATYVFPITQEKYFATTALWGQNITAGQAASNSALLEATIKLHHTALYTRYEFVQKTGEELYLNPVMYSADQQFNINVITAGVSYDLLHVAGVTTSIGGQLSFYHASQELDNLYGKNPISSEIYLHFYPRLMN